MRDLLLNENQMLKDEVARLERENARLRRPPLLPRILRACLSAPRALSSVLRRAASKRGASTLVVVFALMLAVFGIVRLGIWAEARSSREYAWEHAYPTEAAVARWAGNVREFGQNHLSCSPEVDYPSEFRLRPVFRTTCTITNDSMGAIAVADCDLDGCHGRPPTK